ncbi:MAG: hypothetical protein MOB07_03990 [Acidobacteria bacterium]|nr:hypothetical protein [Acidobacteriota bacterium]
MRAALLLALLIALALTPQDLPRSPGDDSQASQTAKQVQRQSLERQIAMQFAPIFYQGLGDSPRSDYITNFDFDGDWKGDNNWNNLDNRSYPLRAYIYYSVSETPTHYFVHYAYFHPRDYKGDLAQSKLLDLIITEGLKQAGKDPTGGLADDVALSHENDLEGCLVVVEKKGQGSTKVVVQYVETMAHNNYFRYCPGEGRAGICEAIEMKDQRPLIFIEPKGHGASRYTGSRQQLKSSINGVMIYAYGGRTGDPDQVKEKSISYDLIPIYDTLWIRARHGENETYGEVFNYKTRAILKFQPNKSAEKVEKNLGSLGSAFRGEVGFRNKARPPWAWFDDSERDRPRGEWFFDPASVIARHFDLGQVFSTVYVYNPYFE